MKLTLERDDGKTEVFNNITDLYIAFRASKNVFTAEESVMLRVEGTSSYSWGTNVRELVKELQQSLVELQEFLRGRQNGDSK